MKKRFGFTLIEMIIVIAIVALTLPVVFAITWEIAREQTKIMRLSIVKKEGDYMLNTIENLLRNNAISIHSSSPSSSVNEICNVVESPTATTALFFEDVHGAWFGFSSSANKVSSSSSNLASPVDLNSSKTIISNFAIGCIRSSLYSKPSVTLVFDICYNTGSGTCVSARAEESATLSYQTRIKLRN